MLALSLSYITCTVALTLLFIVKATKATLNGRSMRAVNRSRKTVLLSVSGRSKQLRCYVSAANRRLWPELHSGVTPT